MVRGSGDTLPLQRRCTSSILAVPNTSKLPANASYPYPLLRPHVYPTRLTASPRKPSTAFPHALPPLHKPCLLTYSPSAFRRLPSYSPSTAQALHCFPSYSPSTSFSPSTSQALAGISELGLTPPWLLPSPQQPPPLPELSPLPTPTYPKSVSLSSPPRQAPSPSSPLLA